MLVNTSLSLSQKDVLSLFGETSKGNKLERNMYKHRTKTIMQNRCIWFDEVEMPTSPTSGCSNTCARYFV